MNFNEKSYTVPAGACPVPVILDTDTYNEIDDQFALVYALLTPECINLRGGSVSEQPFDLRRRRDGEELPGNCPDHRPYGLRRPGSRLSRCNGVSA